MASSLFYGAPEEIRTPDPLVRSQVLYPAELRAHLVVTKIKLRIIPQTFLVYKLNSENTVQNSKFLTANFLQ